MAGNPKVSRKHGPVEAGPERFQIADGLFVMWVDVAAAKEQDLNAQQMQPRHFDRLTENIRARGMIESLPYCHWPDEQGTIEIVSGHHRFRAARAAGLDRIPAVVDTKPMRRSEVIAKQIAHNELHGDPDQQVLAQLVAMIDNVDDLLTTGLPEEQLPTVEPDDTKLNLPHADFDWKLVTLLFLPQQLAEFGQALDALDKHTEVLGYADRDQFEEFARQVHRYGWLHEIRNMATAIAVLTDLAARESELAEQDGVKPGGTWRRTAHLVGPQIPPDAAKVVEDAITKVIQDSGIDPDQPWRALELLCADYLAGG